jgi:hypothetical protein
VKQNWFAMTREQQERLAEDAGMTWEWADSLERMEREEKRESRELTKTFVIIILVFTLLMAWGTRNNHGEPDDSGYEMDRVEQPWAP